jgi:transcriptional regulator with XRE-family HTH domain
MSTDVKLLLGVQIRTLRTSLSLSQEQLAELSGLHRTYVGDVERGERNVSLLNIVKFARALGVSPSHLLKGVE